MKETIYNKETSNCLVLISHKMDENSFKYFSFLQKEADGIMDLIILYDCATCEIKERDYPEFAFHFFDSKEIIDFFHGGNKQLPNPLLALLDLIKVKKYDRFHNAQVRCPHAALSVLPKERDRKYYGFRHTL